MKEIIAAHKWKHWGGWIKQVLLAIYSHLFFAFNRCFPSCKPTGHTNVGFCGSSLKALLHVYIDDASPPCQKVDAFWTQVLYLAEIRCSDENGLSNRRYVLKSEVILQYSPLSFLLIKSIVDYTSDTMQKWKVPTLHKRRVHWDKNQQLTRWKCYDERNYPGV